MAAPILHDRQFGILIAYVVPGFIVVSGLSLHLPKIASWVGPGQQPTVAGFLYVTLASIACGLVVSTVRWLVIDRLLHLTGIRRSHWRLSALVEQLPAFEMFVLYTYRYYQFYANAAVAVPAWTALTLMHSHSIQAHWWAILSVIEIVLLAGARDTLQKYYDRTNELLREPPESSRIVTP